MAEREKVIDILGACGTDDCDDCPLNGDERCSGFVDVPVEVLMDAITLLKEQEPRVLTLEEVCNLKYDDVVYYQGINTNSVESAIVLHGEKMVPEVNTRVVQFRHAGGTGGWNGINNADLNGYGKKWRCWTSRPTPEQMKNTPWKEGRDDEVH